MPKAKSNTTGSRLNVQKTYKIYIGGQFPRTESGRYYKLKSDNGDLLEVLLRAGLANLPLTDRKYCIGWERCWKEEAISLCKS